MKKITADTNIIVSGVINKKGNPARFLELLRDRKFELVLSEPLIEELRVTFSYPHLREKYKITDEVVEDTIAFLREKATIVPGDYETDFLDEVDPKDNKVLACALEGKVDEIVSGDKQHILPLKQFHHIQIISVADFLDIKDDD